MTQAKLEPLHDTDGTRWAWTLTLRWDNDVTTWTLANIGAGGIELALEIVDEELEPIRAALLPEHRETA